MLNPLIGVKYSQNKFYRKVNSLSTIFYMSNLYSVPHYYIGKEVGAVVNNNELIVDYNGSIITKHKILREEIKSQKTYHLSHLESAYKSTLNKFEQSKRLLNSTKKSLEVMKLFLEQKREVIKKCKKSENI